MARRFAPWLVLLAVSLLAFVGTLSTVNQVLRPRSAWENKIIRADPVLYYEIGTGLDPEFLLSGTERVVRFVTHARTPASGLPHDPRRIYDYGLRFDLLGSDDQVFWSREIHTRTRQSKSNPTPLGWLRENSFAFDHDDEIWDDRLLYLTLPPDVPTNSRLRVSIVGENLVALRGYALHERTDFQREVFLLRREAMEPEDKGAVKIGAVRFDQLTDRERHEYSGVSWERMWAEGELGRDYRTSFVYYDGFRLPFDRSGSPQGFVVDYLEPMVVNTVGPGRIRVTAQAPEGDPEIADRPKATRLTITGHSALGRNPLGEMQLGAEATARFVPLTGGVNSIQFWADGAVRIKVDAERPLPTAPTGEGSPGIVEPDFQRVVHFGKHRDGMPVDIALDPANEFYERLYRVTVRSQVELGGEASGEIDVVTLDEHGNELSRTSSTTHAPHAPFERLHLADGERVPVTEPRHVRVVVPAAARTLRVYPRRNAYVRVYMFDPEAERLVAPPYDDWHVASWDWRYPPLLLERWLGVFPDNARELTAALERVAFDAQTRLHRRGGGEGDDARPRRGGRMVAAIEPLGRPPQHFIMTRVRGTNVGRVRSQWPRGSFSRIVPGQAVRVDLGRGRPRSPRLDWEIKGRAADSLGRSIDVLIDGRVVASRTVGASRGSIGLGKVSRTQHSLEIRSDAALRAWIDRPTLGGGAGLDRVRTVYSLGPGGLRVPIRTNGRRKVLNVLVYSHGIEANPEVVIRSEVDRGNMAHVSGEAIEAFTPAAREFSLPVAREFSPAKFSDVRGRSPGYPRVISIPIGADVEPGHHVVHVSSNRRMWACFFVYDQAPAREGSWVRSSVRSEP